VENNLTLEKISGRIFPSSSKERMAPASGNSENVIFLQERGFSIPEVTRVGLVFCTIKGQ